MDTLNILNIPYFKQGNKIHIKEKNKGKFTEYCDGEVTQNCIDKAKNSGNPTLKKRAIFAENARSWKHTKGGQLIPKRKIGLTLDYDPKNPYHVHNNGEKIVITPEQYEKHKNEPYFASIRKQVEEHQAAYPGPEYTETPNPEYSKVYANVKAVSNQHFKEHNFNGQIYREYSAVPENYLRNSVDGVVTDKQGNLYRPMTQADAGKGVTPMFTTTERDYHNGRNFDMSWVRVKTPDKTIKTLKQPLPVNRIYNVDEELNNSVNDYIKNNTLTTEIITNPLYYYKVPPLKYIGWWPSYIADEKDIPEDKRNKEARLELRYYDPNTRQEKRYEKRILNKEIPHHTAAYINDVYFQKLFEEQIRNMYKDLRGYQSSLFSKYPTAEDLLNDSSNRLEMITPSKSKLITKSPTKQQALDNIQLKIN